MANFFKSIFSSNYRQPERLFNGSYFYPVGMAGSIFEGNNLLKEFQEIPELNAVINIVARMDASWKLGLINKATGDEAHDKQLEKLLATPNWFQAQTEFWRQSSLYRSIYGNEYLYMLSPSGMHGNVKAMFTLDPSRVSIKYKSENQYFTESERPEIRYYYDLDNGKKQELDINNIIHLNDNRVNPEKFLTGTSKIESLRAPLANIREAYKKRNVTLKMPVGILSNGNVADATGLAIPMTDKEKENAQHQLRSHGSLPIVTNMAIRYNSMDINAANMGLFEEIRVDVGKICDSYGIAYEMLASEKGVTYANLKEAKKMVYEDTIKPNAKERVDALNAYLDNKTIEIQASHDHLSIFSEDVKNKAIASKQLIDGLDKAFQSGALTIEEYRHELLKYNIISE